MAAETFYSALHWAKKAEASAKLAADLAQTEGKVIQLGFDGSMQDGQLVFKHAPSGVEVPYQLVDDVEYELDLAYNETGDLPNLTEIVVENGNDTIRFISALHRDATTNATVADMDAVMRYNSDTGYRWLFKATYKIAPNGAKVFLLYPVVAAKDPEVARLTEDNLFHGVVASDVGTINFVAQNNNIQKGVTPESNQFVGYDFRGANGDRLAYLGIEYNANGAKQATLQKIDTSLTKLNSGMPISTPTPAVATNDTTVATTNYVNQKVQLVSALPSSPNANIFYFIPG